jgi:hypothetical protein
MAKVEYNKTLNSGPTLDDFAAISVYCDFGTFV